MKTLGRHPTVACVYDASVGAHWIVRYAARLAGATSDRRLRLVRAPAREMSPQSAARRLENVIGECERAGMTVSVEDLDRRLDLSAAVLDRVPAGSGSFLVCGTQIRRGRHQERLAVG